MQRVQRRRRQSVLLVAALLAAVTVPVGLAGPAEAAGSRELYPTDATCQPNSANGQCRASLEWRTDAYGPAPAPVLRRTLLTVYAAAGEVLELGSTAVGLGSADAVVWDPGQITDDQTPTLPTVTSGSNGFRCSTQPGRGRITSRAQELAGPQSADGTGNTGGYVPCTYTAPTSGLYKVAFYGPSGANAATNGAPTADIRMTAAGNFDASQGTSVSAWDVTVRADAASTTDLTGRVFTYALAQFTGNNARPVFEQLYVNTLDGYRYRIDTKGLDPNGFIVFGSGTGFLDTDGAPLDHDVLGTAGGAAMTSLAGGVTIAPPSLPLSFYPLAPVTLAALGIPAAPTAPVISAVSFSGNIGNNNSTVSGGGTFHYSSNVATGNVQVVVSRDGTSYDPGDPANATVNGVIGAAGANTLAWDGKANDGSPFPAGTNYPFHVTLHGGEYHFPLIDAENSTKGGPSFTLQNPPGGTCPFGGSCTTAFFDDRGYTTAGGTDVGTPGSTLCGTAPPATDHAPLNGYDSTTLGRAYGTDAGGNTNASCTGSFGDVKGLDTWTYFPSTAAAQTLNIVASPPPAPAATDDTGSTTAGTALTVPAPGLLSNDSGDAITVTDATTPGHGTVTTTSGGGYTYTPATGFSGTDTFDYTITDSLGRTDTATVTITVTPTATDDATTTTAGVAKTIDPRTNDHGTDLTVTAVGQPPVGQGSTAFTSTGVTYTPPAGFSGTTSFSYTVTDGSNRTATATITVTVGPVATDDTGTTAVDTPLVVPAPGVLGNDTGTGLSVTGHTAPAHGTVSIAADGSYTYTPAPGFSGVDSFDYTLSGAGGSDTATVTLHVTPTASPDTTSTTSGHAVTVDPRTNDHGTGLTVTAVGQPPAGEGTVTSTASGVTYTAPAGFVGTTSFPYTVTDAAGQTATSTVTVTVQPAGPDAVPDAATVAVGHTLTVTGPGVLGNDTGTGLTVTSNTQPAHGSAAVQAGGGYVYVPDPGFSGTDTFTYTVTDGLGRTDTTTVTVTVGPRANPDTATTTNGTPVSVDPRTNDVGTGLHVTHVGQPPAGQGTAAVVGGRVVYTPPAGFTGTVTIPYTVTDASGRTATSTLTVTVTGPGAPIARDDHGRTRADVPLVVGAPGLLGNDDGQQLTVAGHGTPRHGTVVVRADGRWTYTPDRGWSGPDAFTYQVRDRLGRVASATVVVDVTPVAAPDRDATPEGRPVTTAVLHNDTGRALAVVAVTQPAHGRASFDVGAGTVTYTPPAGFTGTVRFTYTVQDAAGQRVTTTVTVDVAGRSAASGLPFTGIWAGPVGLAGLGSLLLGILVLGLARLRRRP